MGVVCHGLYRRCGPNPRWKANKVHRPSPFPLSPTIRSTWRPSFAMKDLHLVYPFQIRHSFPCRLLFRQQRNPTWNLQTLLFHTDPLVFS